MSFKIPKSFGDSNINKTEIAHIIIILVGLFVMLGYRINTTIWDQAEVFFLMGVFSLIAMLVFMALKKFGLKVGMPLADRSIFVSKKWAYIISAIAGIVTFFGIFLSGGQTANTYAIDATTFSLVDPGFWGTVALDVFSFMFENYAFFVVWNAIVFTIGYYLPKLFYRKPSFISGFILVMLVVPVSFMLFHINVHGGNEIRQIVTFAFGVEMTVMQFLFMDVIYSMFRHGGNNLGIIFALTYGSLGGFLAAMVTNPVFIIIVIIIFAIVVYRLFAKRGKK